MYKFEQNKAVKWINGQPFDLEYSTKRKELNIFPMKFKFALNDLLLFYKIINCFVPIKLPEQFTLIKSEEVRCTRKSSAIIEKKGRHK